MISNIKNAYAMLFFERYGKQFYDLTRPPQRHEFQKPPQYQIEKTTGELIPITDKKILDDMPF
jgi:hypothetical protein